MFTVQNALFQHPISLGKLVAGHKGLSNPIEKITVLEIPDAEDFLEENLIALTSFYAIAGDTDKQLRVVRLLAKYNVAALILFNVVRSGSRSNLSNELLNLCDELGLPLIVMPDSVSYSSVIEVVVDRLLDREVTKLQNTIALYETYINQLQTSDDGYTGLLDVLSRLLEKEISFYNHNHVCIYGTDILDIKDNSMLTESIKEYLPQDLSDKYRVNSIVINGISYLIIPIVQNYAYYGLIIIKNMQQPVSDVNQLLIDQTIKALCVSLLSFDRMDEYNYRMKKRFLQDLVLGLSGDNAQVISQAEKLNLKFDNVTNLVIIQLFATGKEYNFFHKHIDCIQDILKAIRYQDIIFTMKKHNQIIALSSLSDVRSQSFLDAVNKVNEYSRKNNIILKIAANDWPSELSEVHDCYLQTVNSIEIAQKLSISSAFISYSDVKIIDLFYKHLNRTDVKEAVGKLLAPVREYDLEHSSDLEKTFASLLSHNLSTSKVADDVFIHRNTVLQRKKNIENLYCCDPFSDKERPKYILAFLLRDLYEV